MYLAVSWVRGSWYEVVKVSRVFRKGFVARDCCLPPFQAAIYAASQADNKQLLNLASLAHV